MRPGLPRTLGIIALALAGLTLGLQAFLAWRAAQMPLSGLHGTPPEAARSFVPLQLTDQRGSSVPFPPLGKAYTLVFFGYTHCPDVCPLGMATMARADRELGHPPALGLAFVTVDPDRDTPAALATFTRSFDSRIAGYTSSASQLATLWDEFGVVVQPASREFVHGESIYLVSADGRILLEYPPDGSAADIAADARRLLKLAAFGQPPQLARVVDSSRRVPYCAACSRATILSRSEGERVSNVISSSAFFDGTS